MNRFYIPSCDTSFDIFLELSDYQIFLRIENQWSYAVQLKITTLYDFDTNSNMIESDDSGKFLNVEGHTDTNHTVNIPLSYRKTDFKIQLFEKENGLLLMLPDKKEFFTVTPRKYEQPYIIRIENDGEYINCST